MTEDRLSVPIDQDLRGKRILITGVCGSVGHELLNQLVKKEPGEIIGLDNSESELFFMMEEYREHDNVQLYLGDIRDRDNLVRRMHGVDFVFHSAALKHVILGEQSPRDVVKTNILGTQNIVDAALHNEVERVLFTSSDKAVNPTNAMGTSKLMGERLMTATNAVRRGDGPIFASTRFGNVLGSQGSVIPIFTRQIAAGGPVTLTEPSMTRFMMTLEEAVDLVMHSIFLSRGGEVFVTKMPVVSIRDLANVMVEELAPRYGYDPEEVKIEVIGSKAGEKIYEELINDEETRRTAELEHYFAVLPAFVSIYEDTSYEYPAMESVGIKFPYKSSVATSMDAAELRAYLSNNRLLEGKG